MAPFRPSRTTRSTRPGGNIDDNLFLDGLPVRQWRQQEATVGAPETYQASARSLKAVDGVADALPEGWAERPMPKGSESYAPYSQMLLRAARMGKYVKSETGPRWGWAEGRADEKDQANGFHTDERKQKDGAESGTHSPQRNLKRKASAEGFVAKRWTLIPREQEPAEDKQYLAKRREGLPPLNGAYYTRTSTGAAGGYATYGADGQIIVNGVTTEPPKRKGPPPRKKHKKGPGRGHKKIVAPLEENGTDGIEGATGESATGPDGDVKMGDVDEHEDDGEGDEGSEEEDAEEADEEDGEGQGDTEMQDTPQSRTERAQDDTPTAIETKLETPPQLGTEVAAAPPPPVDDEFVAEVALPPAPVDPAPPSGSEVETIPSAQPEAGTEQQQEARAEEPEQIQVDAPVEIPVEIPVEVPVEVPVEAPVEIPLQAPVEIPVEAPVEIVPEPEVEATEEHAADQPAPVVVTGSAVSDAIHESASIPDHPVEVSMVEDAPVEAAIESSEARVVEPPPAAPVDAILNSPKPAAPVDAILNPPEPVQPTQEKTVHLDTMNDTENSTESVPQEVIGKTPHSVETDEILGERATLPPVDRPEMESLTPPPASQNSEAFENAPDPTDKPKLPIPPHVSMPQPAEVQSPAAEVEPNYPSPLEEVPPPATADAENIDSNRAVTNGVPQLIHQVSETESPPAEPAQKDPEPANEVAVEELPPAQEG